MGAENRNTSGRGTNGQAVRNVPPTGGVSGRPGGSKGNTYSSDINAAAAAGAEEGKMPCCGDDGSSMSMGQAGGGSAAGMGGGSW